MRSCVQGSNKIQNPEEMMVMVLLQPDVRKLEQMHPLGPHLQFIGGRTIRSEVRVRRRPSELSACGNRARNLGLTAEKVEGRPANVLGEAAQDFSSP